jgi:integrase
MSVGDDVQMSSNTLFAVAAEVWLSQFRSDPKKSPNTVRLYADTMHRYITGPESTIQALPLRLANDPQRLRGLLQRVADGHGTATAKTTKSVLSGILGLAVANGVLQTNALLQVKPVTAASSESQEGPKRDHTRAFTLAERDATVAYADSVASLPGDPRTIRKARATADLVAILAGLGCRIDEARSIRWSDVDLEAGTVRIRGTKSAAADRMLNFPGWLLQRMQVRAERDGTNGLVLPSPGHLDQPERKWDSFNSHKAVRAILDGAGFEWAISHSYRRSVASLLHAQGAPLVRIADQLGHADVSMTSRVYLGRDLTGDKADLADLL